MAGNDQPDAAQEQNFGFQPRSLRQRLVLFVLLPVAVLLFLMGLVGFVFARNSLLTQWQEAAVLKLQRAAHRVDMRLVAPKEWLGIFASTLGLPSASTVQQMHHRAAAGHGGGRLCQSGVGGSRPGGLP